MAIMEFVMPFGKHRGKAISSVPDFYLAWCIENLDPETYSYPEIVKEKKRRQILDREARKQTRPPEPVNEVREFQVAIASVRDAFKSWKRRAMMAYHEDRGASHEVNVAVLKVVQDLEASLVALGVKM